MGGSYYNIFVLQSNRGAGDHVDSATRRPTANWDAQLVVGSEFNIGSSYLNSCVTAQ